MDGKVEALRLVSNFLRILNPRARHGNSRTIFLLIKDPHAPVKLPQIPTLPPNLTQGSHLHGSALC